MAAEKEPEASTDTPRVIIKKYANRRLYNTSSSSYVTLEHLADMVKKGVDFAVFDAKTNEEITRTVLTQIIFEEESQGQSLLPIQFLRQLIGFYGNSMQAFVPSYLELSLASFAKQQETLRNQFAKIGPGVAVGGFDEQIRQNLALFDKAMKMFSPFAYTAGGGTRPTAAAAAPEPTPAAAPEASAPADEALVELRRRMEEMQAQIEKLVSKS